MVEKTPTNRRHKEDRPEYLEWQDHQYDPGYYTGGKIPHWHRFSGSRPLSWFLIFAGMSLAVGMGFVMYILYHRNSQPAGYVSIILGMAVGIGLAWLGVYRIRISRHYDLQRNV